MDDAVPEVNLGKRWNGRRRAYHERAAEDEETPEGTDTNKGRRATELPGGWIEEREKGDSRRPVGEEAEVGRVEDVPALGVVVEVRITTGHRPEV